MTPVDNSPELHAILLGEIRSGGPISFARFMELALYHPVHGYYAREPTPIGPSGDFFTASDAGRAFGRCLARQIVEIDGSIGRFDPFHVIEFGAGRGLLARDICDALSATAEDLSRRLRLVLVERSAAMRAAAAREVPRARVVAPEQLGRAHGGCVLAVELFDALPVHRIRRRAGRIVELYVASDGHGRFAEHEGPPSPGVEAWAERYGAAAEEGAEAEVALQLAPALDTLARAIEVGVIIIVDYGRPAAELFARERRRGTLLAYHAHATNEEYFERVGRQDLTAHVNFSALEDRARELGLAVLGLTTQDRFLISNGILEEFEQRDLRQSRDPRRVKRRLRALQLIHPTGMGRAFRVLLLSKGCAPPRGLSGLADPFV